MSPIAQHDIASTALVHSSAIFALSVHRAGVNTLVQSARAALCVGKKAKFCCTAAARQRQERRAASESAVLKLRFIRSAARRWSGLLDKRAALHGTLPRSCVHMQANRGCYLGTTSSTDWQNTMLRSTPCRERSRKSRD